MLGIIIITVIAFLLSLLLTTLHKFTNKKENNYLNYLPGYNCGACGFGSCEGMAEAMMENVNTYKKCIPLKGDVLIRMEELLKK